MKPAISVEGARKILGKDYEILSDQQIEDAINTLSLIATEMFEKTSKGELVKIHRLNHSSLDSTDQSAGHGE